MFTSHMPLKIQTEPVLTFWKAKYLLVRVQGDILSASYENVCKDIFFSSSISKWKVKKHKLIFLNIV